MNSGSVTMVFYYLDVSNKVLEKLKMIRYLNSLAFSTTVLVSGVLNFFSSSETCAEATFISFFSSRSSDY